MALRRALGAARDFVKAFRRPRLGPLLLLGVCLGCHGSTAEFGAERERMVRTQIEARGVRDERVLAALREVPRHRFVPADSVRDAYEDGPLPIGHGQTISQPYIVAVMTELLAPGPDDVVLDVGTGSGYQAAVLSRLARRVYSIEIVPELADSARARLSALGYTNVEVITGDGWVGLPGQAPFDGILVAAAPPEVPQPLLDQLDAGARLVIPVGQWEQDLRVYERTREGIEQRTVFGVRFVPLVHGEGPQRAPDAK
jgi:protein-L-isoaspartate(D-aspartate) O-methyltransferase